MKKDDLNQEKGGVEMEVRIEEIKRYVEKCPFCSREIKGNSEKGAKDNLKMHMDFCDDNPSINTNAKQ